MTRIDDHSLVELDLTLNWASRNVSHHDGFYVPRLNTWRDLLPDGVMEELMGRSEGEELAFHFPAGTMIPPREKNLIHQIRPEQFGKTAGNESPITPRLGRFYPCGLMTGVPGIYPENILPMRVIDIGEEMITMDLNHPLAEMDTDLKILIRAVRHSKRERGGQVHHWGEEVILGGPGMQAPVPGMMIDYGSTPVTGQAEEGGRPFDTGLRSDSRVDKESSRILGEVYREQVKPGSRILDLMSGARSHLPRGEEKEVVGLGRDEGDMAENPLLTRRVVHDLNEASGLPFPENSFDLVLLSHSMESLRRPEQVIGEVHRVLQPGGSFMVGFTDCWFSTEAMPLWMELHPFERLGWVLSLLSAAGFGDCFTRTYRNRSRPYEDPHYSVSAKSDPVLIAGGIKKG
ncbi:MAG: methyltransferase domain-containing protein [Deltaproteobacteria bacterium]|nr:methyltransferase domain-containing protein [Deltaproteobacteria bacterium]